MPALPGKSWAVAASPWCWSPPSRRCWGGQSCWEASCCPWPSCALVPGLAGTEPEHCSLCGRLSFVCPFILGNKSLCFIRCLLFGSCQDPCCPRHRPFSLGIGQLALSEHGLIGVSAWLSWDKGSTSAASIFSILFPYGAGTEQHWGRLGRETRLCRKSQECKTFPYLLRWLQQGHKETGTESTHPACLPVCAERLLPLHRLGLLVPPPAPELTAVGWR